MKKVMLEQNKVNTLFLKSVLVKVSGTGIIKVSPDFEIRDIDDLKVLVGDIDSVVKSLPRLSDTGYINESGFNIPMVECVVRVFLESNVKIQVSKLEDCTHKSYSVALNKVVYNMILLLLLFIVYKIESWLSESETLYLSHSDTYGDVRVDVKNLKRSITRMINPHLKSKLSNRGISVTLNGYSGYDTEYHVQDETSFLNTMLSGQIAANTGMYLKVPVVNEVPLRYPDISRDDNLMWGDQNKMRVALASIDHVVSGIRNLLYSANDKLLKDIISRVEEMPNVERRVMGGYMVFSFPKTERVGIVKMFESCDRYSSVELMNDCDSLIDGDHKTSLTNIIELLNEISGKEMTDKMVMSIERCVNKHSSRITYKFGDGDSVLSISVRRMLYIMMHYSPAELSMLSDIESFKEELDIIQGSFVTRSRPITKEGVKSSVHIRDTILLSPIGISKLADLGDIYGEGYKKVDIGGYRGDMKRMLDERPLLFAIYGMTDSYITLKHGNSMEEFYFSLGKLGVPLTSTGLSKSYVLLEWMKMNYGGYHVIGDVNISDLASLVTPKKARSADVSNYIVSYVSAYRGGRNESFMYGYDQIQDGENRVWYDYDLVSAYTSVMSLLGHPDMEKAGRVYDKKVKTMTLEELLLNYVVLDVVFKFPKGTKYPCIPARVDDAIDIYPLEGRSIITGSEYWVAKSMGCELMVKSGVVVPFVKDSKKVRKDRLNYMSPYRQIMEGLQSKRRSYPKKSFYDQMYKLIGNSVYGLVSQGISGKTAFDIKTKSYVKVGGGELANPILASYITGFCRAVVGECLNNVEKLGGSVVSVTTDGFISDIDNLEDKIIENEAMNKDCLLLYREIRHKLTALKDASTGEVVSNDSALEIKVKESKGIVSWKTRGQLGFDDKGLKAMAGFQARQLERPFLVNEFIKRISSIDEPKKFDFVESGLRKAIDVYKQGGHVLMKYRDKSFSLEYDNKRRIVGPWSISNTMSTSVPWCTINDFWKIRVLKETVNSPVFVQGGFVEGGGKGYKSTIETSIRGFIKAAFSECERYGIPKEEFRNYNSIIKFIHEYEPAHIVKLTKTSVSNLKCRVTIPRAVPRTKETEGFIDFVKSRISTFESDRFFRELSAEAIRAKKKASKNKKAPRSK